MKRTKIRLLEQNHQKLLHVDAVARISHPKEELITTIYSTFCDQHEQPKRSNLGDLIKVKGGGKFGQTVLRAESDFFSGFQGSILSLKFRGKPLEWREERGI